MYNKEALRKELEDCWDAALMWKYFKDDPTNERKRPARDTYITTRLAALDDGDDEINPQTGKPYFEGLNKKGQWNRQFVDDGQGGEDKINVSKTKADILKEQFKDDFMEFKQKSGAFVLVIESMEEYAAQFRTPALPVADGEGENDYWGMRCKAAEDILSFIAKHEVEVWERVKNWDITINWGNLKSDMPSAVTGGVKDGWKKVCYCGSLRFIEVFQTMEYNSVFANEIALLPCCMFADIEREYGVTSEYKKKADELHKHKIDICDEVYVLNVGGYTGESTKSEIEYAIKIGKPIKYLEPPTDEGQPAQGGKPFMEGKEETKKQTP